jgi:hypothetical protein
MSTRVWSSGPSSSGGWREEQRRLGSCAAQTPAMARVPCAAIMPKRKATRRLGQLSPKRRNHRTRKCKQKEKGGGEGKGKTGWSATQETKEDLPAENGEIKSQESTSDEVEEEQPPLTRTAPPWCNPQEDFHQLVCKLLCKFLSSSRNTF